MRKTVLYLSAASLFLSSYTLKNDKEYSLAEEHIKNLPEAPEGYKWVVKKIILMNSMVNVLMPLNGMLKVLIGLTVGRLQLSRQRMLVSRKVVFV